jgi:hypothetical protein
MLRSHPARPTASTTHANLKDLKDLKDFKDRTSRSFFILIVILLVVIIVVIVKFVWGVVYEDVVVIRRRCLRRTGQDLAILRFLRLVRDRRTCRSLFPFNLFRRLLGGIFLRRLTFFRLIRRRDPDATIGEIAEFKRKMTRLLAFNYDVHRCPDPCTNKKLYGDETLKYPPEWREAWHR